MSQKNKKLSAIIIARNEEPRIAQCISALSFAEEIIVVNNGSTDNTKQIASSMGARVIDTNDQSFSKIRMSGMEKATGEWILYVDADETVTDKLSQSIKEALNNGDEDIAAYRVLRKNIYLGTPWPMVEKLERLFKRSRLSGWYGDVHETPTVVGVIADLQGELVHNTHRTIYEMTEKTNAWSDIEARLRLQNKHPPVVTWRLFRVMCTGFCNSFFRQGGWKAGTAGSVESIFQAFSMFITYAKLWELQRKPENK